MVIVCGALHCHLCYSGTVQNADALSELGTVVNLAVAALKQSKLSYQVLLQNICRTDVCCVPRPLSRCHGAS